MTSDKRTKRKTTKKDYRISVNFDRRIADKLLADSERKGIGVLDVIRIAAAEYVDRLAVQSN